MGLVGGQELVDRLSGLGSVDGWIGGYMDWWSNYCEIRVGG